MAQRSRKRCFRFTLNNYKEEDVEFYKNLECEYLVFGKEICPTTGTPHLQGYVRFTHPREVSSIQNFLRGHILVADAGDFHNYNYCTKENREIFEKGKRPKGQGKRTDIELVKELVKTDTPIKEIYEQVSSFQALKFAEKGIQLFGQKRTWKPKVLWFWGPTGSGKTRTAIEMCPEAWISGRNLKWWEGYEGQTEVIFDDFRKDFCTFHELLRILDRYPYTVEVKGGSRQLLAKYIIITCPKTPDLLYETKEDIGQLIRRIDEIRFFPGTAQGTEVKGNNMCDFCNSNNCTCFKDSEYK